MAHGYIDKGRDTTFVSKKQLPWHTLGKIVDAMTSEEAIVLGGMDFEVGLSPLYMTGEQLITNEVKQTSNVIKNTPEGEVLKPEYYNRITIPNKFCTKRMDNHHPLGVVGSRYTPIQNREAFEFFDRLIGEGHAEYETAGALGNGEVVFITAKLPDYVKVEGEKIDNYLLLTMAHDGSGAIQAMFTPTRVVCNNTLSFAIGEAKNKVVIRHTKSAKEKMNNLERIMGMTNDLTEEMNESFARLQDLKVNQPDVEQLYMNVLGLKPMEETNKLSTKAQNILNDSLKYYEKGFGQSEVVGTGWGVLNGITGYYQNVKNFRSDESAFASTFIKSSGNDAGAVRQRLFNKLIEMAELKSNTTHVFN